MYWFIILIFLNYAIMAKAFISATAIFPYSHFMNLSIFNLSNLFLFLLINLF